MKSKFEIVVVHPQKLDKLAEKVKHFLDKLPYQFTVLASSDIAWAVASVLALKYKMKVHFIPEIPKDHGAPPYLPEGNYVLIDHLIEEA